MLLAVRSAPTRSDLKSPQPRNERSSSVGTDTCGTAAVEEHRASGAEDKLGGGGSLLMCERTSAQGERGWESHVPGGGQCRGP